eukprot:2157397-Alexandrium_andersonii.AAC.1
MSVLDFGFTGSSVSPRSRMPPRKLVSMGLVMMSAAVSEAGTLTRGAVPAAGTPPETCTSG